MCLPFTMPAVPTAASGAFRWLPFPICYGRASNLTPARDLRWRLSGIHSPQLTAMLTSTPSSTDPTRFRSLPMGAPEVAASVTVATPRTVSSQWLPRRARVAPSVAGAAAGSALSTAQPAWTEPASIPAGVPLDLSPTAPPMTPVPRPLKVPPTTIDADVDPLARLYAFRDREAECRCTPSRRQRRSGRGFLCAAVPGCAVSPARSCCSSRQHQRPPRACACLAEYCPP